MLDNVLYAWFALTAVSVAYVAWDAFRYNPEMTVMKWGWVLVTLYTGIFGLVVYVLSCKEPAPGSHERFITPLWKQSVGSTIHCVAGDATGIVIAAAITAALRLPMWLDLISEYAFGFAFGWTIFQSLFMRDMTGGSYRAALRSTFLPEWLSMNGVMAGMIPTMVILMTRDMTGAAMKPESVRFWGVMSFAVLVGTLVAYPINVWLVFTGLKHGMGTVRALGSGGHTVEAEEKARKAGRGAAPAMGGMHP